MQREFFTIVFILMLGYHSSQECIFTQATGSSWNHLAKREEKRVTPKFSKRVWSPARPVRRELESCYGSKVVYQNSADFLIFTLMLCRLPKSSRFSLCFCFFRCRLLFSLTWLTSSRSTVSFLSLIFSASWQHMCSLPLISVLDHMVYVSFKLQPLVWFAWLCWYLPIPIPKNEKPIGPVSLRLQQSFAANHFKGCWLLGISCPPLSKLAVWRGRS